MELIKIKNTYKNSHGTIEEDIISFSKDLNCHLGDRWTAQVYGGEEPYFAFKNFLASQGIHVSEYQGNSIWSPPQCSNFINVDNQTKKLKTLAIKQ